MLKDKSNKDDRNDYLLVVCIDNLDRCPHRQIVKVLEAVHLLLEYTEVRPGCARTTLIFMVRVSLASDLPFLWSHLSAGLDA